MRTAEQKQWKHLASVMSGLWDAQRHEDKYSPDIADVSWARAGVEGWIELKTIKAWPSKDSTPVRIGHLSGGQVNWLETRGRMGTGRVFVLLAVGDLMHEADWVLIPHFNVRAVYEACIPKDVFLTIMPRSGGGKAELRSLLDKHLINL